jgi:hypothetical protein
MQVALHVHQVLAPRRQGVWGELVESLRLVHSRTRPTAHPQAWAVSSEPSQRVTSTGGERLALRSDGNDHA